MLPEIIKTPDINKSNTNIYLISDVSHLAKTIFDERETEYISKRLSEKNQDTVILNKLGHIKVVCKLASDENTTKDKMLEKYRKTGESLLGLLNDHKIESVSIVDSSSLHEETIAFAEGMNGIG